MRWITAVLTWFAADPQAIDNERPRAASACQMAHATMLEVRDDAEQDQDFEAALGETGGGRETAEGREQAADGSGARVSVEGSQGVASSCADGRCVDVPRMRTSSQRKR